VTLVRAPAAPAHRGPVLEDAPLGRSRERPGVRGHLHCSAAPGAGEGLRVRTTASGPLRGVHHPLRGGPDVLLLSTDVAGLAAGDALDVRVEVAAGASLVVSDPAPTQLLPGPPARTGRMSTRVEVTAGGALVLLPHALVPLRRSRSDVSTVVRVDSGARVAVGGVLAPGRVATGEVWAMERLDSTTDLLVDGELVVRDALRVESHRLRRPGPGHLVSLLLVGDGDARLLSRVREVASAVVGDAAGVSALTDDVLALRALTDSQSAGSALLRAVVTAARPELAGWRWARVGHGDWQ
jgi:urease accessory protein UreH